MFWLLIIIWLVVFYNGKKGTKNQSLSSAANTTQPTVANKNVPTENTKRKSELVKYILGAISVLCGVQSFIDPSISGFGHGILARLVTSLILVAVGALAIYRGLYNTKIYTVCEGVIKKDGNTPIDQIAMAIKRPYDEAVSVVSSMLKKNYFPHAYIDYKNRLLVMTKEGQPMEPIIPFTGKVCPHCNGPVAEDAVYCIHCGKQIKATDEQIDQTVNNKSTKVGDKAFITEIEALIKNIGEQEFVEKLTVLKDVSEKIYDRVKDDDDSVSSIRKFANIYMPAIINAVKTYESVRDADCSIDETLESRKDAMDALDMGVDASKKLLNQLYQPDQLNVSVELEMLKRMMEADGLIQEQDSQE